VRINYTGKIKESGKVFDTTVEKVAKESGIYDEKIRFKATPIVIGAGHVIQGLDEALVGAEVGERKVVEIPPEKGYGLRNPNLVKIVPLKDFKKQGLKPFPGMRVEAEGKIGKVQSVGGGRVRVDFNYELAGKALEYEVTVEEKVNKTEEKMRLLMEYHFPYADSNEHEIRLSGKKAIITPAEITKVKKESLLGKHSVARDIFRFIEGVQEVDFVDVFKKPKEKKPKEKESAGKKPRKKKTKMSEAP
jgi:FKBP-type peptidyl-prolyl cis-trans isomerase SlyD